MNESLDEEPAIDITGRPTHGAALNTSYAESRPWRGVPGGKAQSVGAMSGVGGRHKLRTKPGTTVHMGRPGKMSSGAAFPVSQGRRNIRQNYGSLGHQPPGGYAAAFSSAGGQETIEFSTTEGGGGARESVKDRAQRYYHNR